MTVAAKCLRLLEIALVVAGISFLGVAIAATVHRWDYQARQERALFGDAAVLPARSHTAPVLPSRGETAAIPRSVGLAVAPPDADSSVVPAHTDVPVPRRHEARTVTRHDDALDPLALGMIEIPRIGVRAVVREGTDDPTLALAVGHLPGSALPGESGNMVLAGHRDTFFRELRDIRVEDTVRLVVPSHRYAYRVVSLQVVEPDESSVLDSTGDEELTLVTCYPFQYVGPAPKRFIVRAVRVE